MPLWLAAYDEEANTIPSWDAPLDAYLHRDLAAKTPAPIGQDEVLENLIANGSQRS